MGELELEAQQGEHGSRQDLLGIRGGQDWCTGTSIKIPSSMPSRFLILRAKKRFVFVAVCHNRLV